VAVGVNTGHERLPLKSQHAVNALINVQGDSFSFYRRIPISVDGDLSLVLIMIYDEKLSTFDPAQEYSSTEAKCIHSNAVVKSEL